MPAGHHGLSWSKLFLLLHASSAIALQQQPQDGQPASHAGRSSSGGPRSSGTSLLQPTTVKHAAHRSSTPQIDVSYAHFRDTHAAPASGYIANNKHHSKNKHNNNERAVATLAPAQPSAGAKARRHSQQIVPARSAAGPTGGLAGLSARSLQDWEVEDLVLLATVDGKIHARDRKTGTREKWVFTPKDRRPTVETIYHHPDSDLEGAGPEDGLIWVVEPSQDGALYIFNNKGTKGIQKLGLTVKDLFERAPFSISDPPIKYEAASRRSLFTVSATTGREAKGQPTVIAEECRLSKAFGDQECASQNFLELGRTDYTITISNTTTGEATCTIHYSEWGPNTRDRDLEAQYASTMDNLYVHSFHDGGFYNVDVSKGLDLEALELKSRNKVPSPVVRVLDVARNTDPESKDPPLAVLPQPSSGLSTLDFLPDSVFVNTTGSGTWYAMSEQKYPFVTSFAKIAQCYAANIDADTAARAEPVENRDDLVGIHYLTEFSAMEEAKLPTLPPPEVVIQDSDPYNHMMIDAGNTTPFIDDLLEAKKSYAFMSILYTLGAVALAALCGYVGKDALIKLPGVPAATAMLPGGATTKDAQLTPEDITPNGTLTDATAKTAKEVRFAEAGAEGDVVVKATTSATLQEQSRAEAAEAGGDDATETPKKKAHRGQRGGTRRNKQKNRRESEVKETMTEQLGRQIDGDHEMQPDENTQMTGSISDVSTTVRLNNLEILKDLPLGYGSGGTVVYQGKFEGREVAVKQMMPQYYELVDQEVNMLRDSDDHPNVIRYYCTQKDVNFHYIALERCQASLFDLYKDGGSRDSLTDDQMQLVTQINSNIPSALQQLAAGLAHLHQLRIIHRDIKPQNILITYPRKSQKSNFPRFVISDFGLCKTLPDNMSTLMGTTGNAGTIGWKAPELITNPRMSDAGQSSQGNRQESTSSNDGGPTGVKRAIDIFSLGCVFFYVLTNGSHPFDADKNDIGTIIREVNIKRNNMNLEPLNIMGDEAEEPMHLIGWMLAPNPSDRPTAQVVLKHPFFWSDAVRLAFLCDVSDHFERE